MTKLTQETLREAITAVVTQGAAGAEAWPVSEADGANVALGAIADAAIITDAAGTLSSKLRGLVKWAFERMPAALGQATKAASLPVVLPGSASGTYASAVSVTNAATLIKAAVAARIRLELHHQGPDSAARVWLGLDNTITAGASGKNVGYLDPGDSWERDDYTGDVYGRTEAGTAYISYLEV